MLRFQLLIPVMIRWNSLNLWEKIIKMHFPSYAKINLALRVLGKRPDGYHDIETIFQQIDLSDTLQISVANRDISVTSTDSRIPVDENNLCYQAARALQKYRNVKTGARIFIEKVLPTGAGLGGGSSNAAATLMALNKLWNLGLSRAQLLALGIRIGSDVPFFIIGGAAYALGRGEKLFSIRLRNDYWGVLIYPNIEISTRWAYESLNFNLTNSKKSITLRDFVNDNLPLLSWQNYLSNDLEAVVFQRFPILQQIKLELSALGAFFSSMSGSGSAIYGLFDTPRQATMVANKFSSEYRTFVFVPV